MKRLPLHQRIVFSIFCVLAVLAATLVFRLKFSFDFEQFFPLKDPDLIYFQKFVQEFETDDNFMLVAVRRSEGVFDSVFLDRFAEFTRQARDLPYVTSVQSLTKVRLPVMTPFGVSTVPALNINEPAYYAEARKRLTQDERFKNTLISEDGTALVVFLRTIERIDLQKSEQLLAAIDSLVARFDFEAVHRLGRSCFQVALVDTTKKDVAVSAVIAVVLVSILLWFIFGRWRTNLIVLINMGVSLLLFLGLMALFNRELSAMAALYPVLLVIIGTSDSMHLLSKYLDELKHGLSRPAARRLTIKEIGLATFMTAATTSVGFLTLLTSRIKPVQEFGVNAAMGVMTAFVTSITLGMAMMSLFEYGQLTKDPGDETSFWNRLMERIYNHGRYRNRILLAATVVMGIFLYGISLIKTNYSIADMLPLRNRVTDDFHYFEKNFAGFRPVEFAVELKPGYKVHDFSVVRQIDSIERHLRTISSIRSVNSVTTLHKSINQMMEGGREDAYRLPADEATYNKYLPLVEQMPKMFTSVLVSRDGSKTRISTKINDLGADSVMAIGDRISSWIRSNTDTTIMRVVRTGTGYVLDKNATYVRKDLIEGILLEVVLIALLMALVLRTPVMILIFLIPNLFPLFFAGAVMGYLNIPLDAGISMVFTVVFGIAIDDTIHFLSSFDLNRRKGLTVEQALHTTMLETGKPVVLTTVILFVGFFVMLFSHYPPTHTVGILIAVTLISALLSDLYLNPLLIRYWVKDKRSNPKRAAKVPG